MSNQNPSEFQSGRATYSGQDLPNNVLSLKAKVRAEQAHAARWEARHDDVAQLLRIEQATVSRVRSLPRHITAGGEWVVYAADLDRALEVTR